MELRNNNSKIVNIKFLKYRDLLLWDIKRYIAQDTKSYFPLVKLGPYIKEQTHKIKPYDFPEQYFKILGVNNKIGIFDAYIEKGTNISQAYKLVQPGWLAYNPYRVNVGSIGLRTNKHKHEYISPAYVVISCNEALLPDYLLKLFKTDVFKNIIKERTTGSVRQSLTADILKTLDIALPTTQIQQKLLKAYYIKAKKSESYYVKILEIEKEIENTLYDVLGINNVDVNESRNDKLQYIRYNDLLEWGINKIGYASNTKSSRYAVCSLSSNPRFVENVFRGKSPIYKTSSDFKILNQKCIKWNEIDIRHTKSVDADWLNNIDDKYFTKDGDILINSTGEGTIGRAALITTGYSGLMYDSHILCLRLNHNLINPLYWTLVFNSSYGQKQVTNLKSAQTTKQTELGISNVLKIKMPIPELKTQVSLIKTISRFKSKIIVLNKHADKLNKDAIKEFEQAIFKL